MGHTPLWIIGVSVARGRQDRVLGLLVKMTETRVGVHTETASYAFFREAFALMLFLFLPVVGFTTLIFRLVIFVVTLSMVTTKFCRHLARLSCFGCTWARCRVINTLVFSFYTAITAFEPLARDASTCAYVKVTIRFTWFRSTPTRLSIATETCTALCFGVFGLSSGFGLLCGRSTHHNFSHLWNFHWLLLGIVRHVTIDIVVIMIIFIAAELKDNFH
jgi:hypothetical protein